MNNAITRAARRAARIAAFAGVSGVLLPAHAVRRAFTKESKRERVLEEWTQMWSGAVLSSFGITPSLVGDVPPMIKGRGRLVVCNHKSAADIVLLAYLFPGHFVSRADLAKWPIVSALARVTGTVFVDRESQRSGASAVLAMTTLLREEQSVTIFPEGTTFDGDDVHLFHMGGFVASTRAEAEIVPVGLAYETGSGAAYLNETFTAHLSRMAAAPPSRVGVAIGSAIEAGPNAKPTALRDAAHAAVTRLVAQARARVDQPPPTK